MTHIRLPHRTPKDWEIKQATHAMDMLFSIECLPYVIYDLTEEVKATGQYKQEVKRRINQAEKAIRYAADRAYYVFARMDEKENTQNRENALSTGFIRIMDKIYSQVEESVLIGGIDGKMNVLVAFVNILTTLNSQLCDKYQFEPVERLRNLPSVLSCIEYTRYDVVEVIIKKILNNRKYEVN